MEISPETVLSILRDIERVDTILELKKEGDPFISLGRLVSWAYHGVDIVPLTEVMRKEIKEQAYKVALKIPIIYITCREDIINLDEATEFLHATWTRYPETFKVMENKKIPPKEWLRYKVLKEIAELEGIVCS